MVRFPLMILLVLCVSASFAQSKKRSKKEAPATEPSSLAPGVVEKSEKDFQRRSKKKSKSVTYDAREDFYDRMGEVAKAHRKAEKELEKPQYSDPSYFGHKRPPKKRPPHKMKFCKVCEIRH